MATSIQDIKDKYPLPVFYYRVTIAGEDSVAFYEVSGLNINYETLSYYDGMSYRDGVKLMPGMPAYVTLTLKKGVVRRDNYFFKWISTIQLNTVEKRDLRVDLLDETGEAVVSWTVTDAFPHQLDAPVFNAAHNEVAIETLELVASSLRMDYPG
jgi:phage tail-like protein